MKTIRMIVYNNGIEVEDITITHSESYIFYSNLHPEIMQYSKKDVIKEIESRLD